MGCLLTPFYQKEVIALSNTKAGLCELSITINGNHAAKVEIKLLHLNETIEMNLNKRGVEILMKRVQANPVFVVCKKTIFTQPIQFDLSKN